MRIHWASSVLVLAAALGLAACGQGGGGSLPDDVTGAWEVAFNKGDAAGIAAIYADDARLMPPNHALINGREAIQEYMKEGFGGASGMQMSIKADESVVMGPQAYRRGTYRITGADGAELEVGKYVEVWKKAGENWQIAIDIWNTDTAAAPAPAPGAEPAAGTAPAN